MRRFGGAFFGGYKKEDVDEYVSFLENELESLKSETNIRLEKQNKTIDDLKNRLSSAESESRAEIENIEETSSEKDRELEAKAGEIMAKDKELEELRNKLAETEQKLSETEAEGGKLRESDENIYKLLDQTRDNIRELEDNAKLKAADIEKQAETKAKDIVKTGKLDAVKYKKEAEAEIQRGVEQVKLAKYDLYEYLVAIKKAQDSLVASYNELGSIINKFPAKMEQLAMDASFELKTDKEFDWHGIDIEEEEL